MKRKGMDKSITIFAAIILALIVVLVLVSLVSSFFKKAKSGEEGSYRAGADSVSLSYNMSLCKTECIDLCFQGILDPKCSYFPSTDINAKCECGW